MIQMSLSESPSSATPRKNPGFRRQEILQTLATLLEQPVGTKITTALLAQQLNLSEAALYRHFASKAKMFEALIEFIEETLFTRINRIFTEIPFGLAQTEALLTLLLGFADKNPGMTRMLTGEVLQFEDARLQARVRQLNDRLEASLRQSLRLTTLPEVGSSHNPNERNHSVQAGLLMALVAGRWHLYSTSQFSRSPLQDWDQLWRLIKEGLGS